MVAEQTSCGRDSSQEGGEMVVEDRRQESCLSEVTGESV